LARSTPSVQRHIEVEAEGSFVMPDRPQERQGFERAMGEARRQATHVADHAGSAARKTANSFETAAREIVENQPYTAVGIALAVGWLLGRMHRPI